MESFLKLCLPRREIHGGRDLVRERNILSCRVVLNALLKNNETINNHLE